MSEIRFDSEQKLLDELLQSQVYKEFKKEELLPKIEREKQAWKWLGG